MGDAEIGLCLHHHRLGCHATGPEDRNLFLPNRYRISKVGSIQISYPDLRRIADVDRASVNGRISGRNLGGPDDLVRRQRPHADYHGAVHGPCRLTWNIRDIHGNILILFEMADGDFRP